MRASALCSLAAVQFLALFSFGGESAGPSSRRTPFAITEIHYNPAQRADGRNLEFVEIYNSQPWPQELGGYRLEGEAAFEFPEGAMIGAQGFVVIAANPGDLEAELGIAGAFGPIEGSLDNGGGELRLLKQSGAVLLDLRYDDRAPWPLSADGTGHSLVLARPSFGEADSRAWRASAFVGGSPGAPDPAPAASALRGVRISEVHSWPTDGQSGFIEVANITNEPVDISNCVLTGTLGSSYRFGDGSTIPPGGFVTVVASDLGPGFAPGPARYYLWSPDGSFVIDSWRSAGQHAGLSNGPDGALSEPTPGMANAPAWVPPVVINELMFHPVNRDAAAEFIELHNWGMAPVDIAGWRFSDGISFTFPEGSAIEAGGYLVIAKDRSQFLARYPGVDASVVLGNYEGELSNRGERVALSHPTTHGEVSFEAVVDEVTYLDGGAWGRWSDGGGSSLELINPRAVNDHGSNWADSDETGKAEWIDIRYEGLLEGGKGSANRFQVFLLGGGQADVDDIVVAWEGRENLVANGDFGSDSGWTLQGTHRPSQVADGILRIDAVDRGDIVSNRIFHRVSPVPRSGTRATISARARWKAGHSELMLRLKGGYLATVASLPVPQQLGTPGAVNSRHVENAPPTISEISHQPTTPAANQEVVVSARIEDSDGVGAAFLRYRLDPSNQITEIAMERQADGRFAATIPGQSAGELAAFTIVAEDSVGPVAVSAETNREGLILFGDGDYETERFGTYRIWLTAATEREWRTRPKMSNEPLPITFVYGNDRAVHSAGAWYSGSAFTSPGYDSPTGRICGYDISFPEDQRFLGARKITLDFPVRDPTAQREQLMYWFADQLGLPNNHRRYVHLWVNGRGNRSRPGWGSNSSSIYEDVQQPNSDMIREWFPTGTDGYLFKGDYWHEFDDRGARQDPASTPQLEHYEAEDGARQLERYRYTWRPRAVRESANDFSALFDLIDAVNVEGDTFRGSVEDEVDVENWMRTWVANDLASNWDSFGNGGAKNTFHYKPQGGRWHLMSWDFDVGLGVFNDSPGASLFTASDPAVRNIQRDPVLLRHYWQAMHEAVTTFFTEEAVTAVVVPKYEAMREAGVRVTSPQSRSGESGRSIPDWVDTRRRFLLRQMDEFTEVPFAVNGLPSEAFQQSGNLLALSGSAPVQVEQFLANGEPLSVEWTDTNLWNAFLFLEPGLNNITLGGVDRNGDSVEGVRKKFEVTVTGAVEPVDGNIVINEIMFRPGTVPDAEFLEFFNRSQTTAYDVSGWQIDEIGLIFPERSIIGPGGFLLAVLDRDVFNRIHGSSLPVAGQYAAPILENAPKLLLRDRNRTEMDRVDYVSDLESHAPAYGQGASLQLVDPNADNGSFEAWGAVDPSASSAPRVAWDSSWRYFEDGAAPEDWKSAGFDDAGWAMGTGLIGVSDALLPVPINSPLSLGKATYYFRTRFDLAEIPSASLQLETLVDDGLVLYVNGTEAVRLRLGDGPVGDQTFARPSVPDAELEGPFELSPDLFVRGENLIAAEVHQSVLNSADVLFGIQLTASGDAREPSTPGSPNSTRRATTTGTLVLRDLDLVVSDDGSVKITFTPPEIGADYQLFRSDELLDWLPVGDSVPGGNKSEIIDSLPGGTGHRFYRVVQLP